LCGTYSWVFDGDTQRECEEADFGSLELRLLPGKRPRPASLTGYIELGTLQGHFHGLKKAEEGEKLKMNYWDMKLLKWEEVKEGHRFGATKVVDDNSNHFIEFLVDRDYVGWPPHQSMYLAKKRKDENLEEELTDEERERLGICMDDDEVVKLAKRVKRKERVLSEDHDGDSGSTQKQKAWWLSLCCVFFMTYLYYYYHL
jgi:hypothetical protein